MADRPKLLLDNFSVGDGSATFQLIWSNSLNADDKADLLDWLKLVERRIARLPEGGDTHEEPTP